MTAREVAENVLDATGKALLAGDFDAFASYFALPHTLETPDQKTILKTSTALRTVFDRVSAKYIENRVTELIRICDVAEFVAPDRIHATHTTHMMSGNTRLEEPFPIFSIFQRVGDDWISTASQYAVVSSSTLGGALGHCLTTLNTAPAPAAATEKEKRPS